MLSPPHPSPGDFLTAKNVGGVGRVWSRRNDQTSWSVSQGLRKPSKCHTVGYGYANFCTEKAWAPYGSLIQY